MPSKNMLPKGQRHHSVRAEYRAQRGLEPTPVPIIPILNLDPPSPPERDQLTDGDEAADLEALEAYESSSVDPQTRIRTFPADPAAANMRLDLYLAQALPDISRARVQLLIEAGQVRVDRLPAKPKQKLKGGELIEIEGEPRPAPLNATPEDIPLQIVFEDQYLAVVNKPAGMMVHAGAGASADARNQGTLVNALLYHLNHLSGVNGDLRPGIVHRLDKQTSGLLLVAKDDVTHRHLGDMFAQRAVSKTYLALVHGNLPRERTTVQLPISRDRIRRTRMTTRNADGRTAVSHFRVLERITAPLGTFTLVEATIETGRTHQIRVHLQSLGTPVVGDTLYGAPHHIGTAPAGLELHRNFLHAYKLAFTHPRTSKPIALEAPLPPDLEAFLTSLRHAPATL